MLGPVQFIAFGFDTIDRFRGEILDELELIAPLDSIRILDALVVAKEDNGDLIAVEADDVGLAEQVEVDDAFGTILGALMGFDFEGDDPDLPPAEVATTSATGVSVADVQRIGRDLAPGTAAGLLLIEHRWSTGLRDAINRAGGYFLGQGFLSLDGMVLVGAELAATAAAIDAIEVAEALETEARLRSVEALAAIEVADEIEAAVVARTIRTLVEADVIESAVAEHAMATVIDAALIESAVADSEGSA